MHSVLYSGHACCGLLILLCGALLASGQPPALQTISLTELRAALPPLPPPPASAPNPEEPVLLEEARRRVRAGEFAQALTLLQDHAATQGMQSGPLAALYADLLYQARRWRDALAMAQRSASLDAAALDGHYLVAQVAAALDQPALARQALLRATGAEIREADSPRRTLALFHLARSLEQDGYLTAALESYEAFDETIWHTHPEQRLADEVARVLRARPEGALLLRIDLLRRLSRAAEAVDIVRDAVADAPDDAGLRRVLVDLLLTQGRGAEALDALGSPPTDPLNTPWLRLRALHSADQLDAHLAEMATALQDADSAIPALRIAQRLERLGQGQAAAHILDTVPVTATGRADALWQAARLRARSGALKEAAAGLQTALQAGTPPSPAVWRAWFASHATRDAAATRPAPTGDAPAGEALPGDALAAALLAIQTGDRSRAEDLLSALAAAPDAALLETLATGYQALGTDRASSALERAQTALARSPRQPAALLLRALALADLDADADAGDAFRRALAAAPDDPAILAAMASFLQRTGDTVGAQRRYQEALVADPTNADALERLIDSYLADGKIEVARQRLRQAPADEFDDITLRRIALGLRMAAASPQDYVDELRRLHALDPQRIGTGVKLAVALLRTGQLDEAARVIAPLRVSAPREEDLIFVDIAVQRSRLDFARVAALAETLVERYPNRGAMLSMLVQARQANFEPHAARQAQTRLIESTRDDALRTLHLLELLGIYERFRDYDGALAQIDAWESQELPQATREALREARLELLVAAGRADEALRAAEAALDAEPTERSWTVFLTVAQRARVFDGAIARLQTAIQADANPALTAQLKLYLRTMLRDAGRGAELVELIRQDRPTPWQQALDQRREVAEAWLACGPPDKAVREFEALLNERPVADQPQTLDQLRRRLLVALLRAKEFDRGLNLIDEWYPEPRAPAIRANVLAIQMAYYQSMGRTDLYLAAAEGLHELSRDEPGINNDLGYTWVDHDMHVEKATGMIRRAVASDPLNAAYLDSLGWAYYKAGDFAAAREQLQRAAQLQDGQDPVQLDHLGDAEFRCGNVAAAKRAWELGVRLFDQLTPERQSLDAALRERMMQKLAALESSTPPPIAPTAAERAATQPADGSAISPEAAPR